MKRIALFAALSLSAGLALADPCTDDMKAVDAALTAKARQLDEAALTKVRKLRADAEALHKAGKHNDAVAKLSLAKEQLQIN